MTKYRNTRTPNKYANKPFPRPLTEAQVGGYKEWEPNSNPGAVKTLARDFVEQRRRARRIRSLQHLPRHREPVSACGPLSWRYGR